MIRRAEPFCRAAFSRLRGAAPSAAQLLVAALLLSAALLPSACSPATPALEPDVPAVVDWNGARVAWREYDAGFAEARASGKPVLLVFYTDWCPHCHNYSRLFHVPEVVELSASFVMIRVERDGHPELSARHVPDGDYVPRTFFFDAAGSPMAELTSDNPEYNYFLDEHDAGELIDLMMRARERAAQLAAPAARAR